MVLPFGWEENSTNWDVSSSASPQFLCPSSNKWYRYSHWLKTLPIKVWAPQLGPSSLFLTPCTGAPFSLVESLTYESVSSSASPQFLISYSMHWCAILIGWKLNLWERELLSQSPVPVSVLYLVAALYRHLKAGWIPSSFLSKHFFLRSSSKCCI